MPTISAALAALERHCGFPQSRSRTIARRLQEGGSLPLGASGTKPLIDDDGFVALFVALAGDTTLHEAAPRTQRLLEMIPGGGSLVGAPAHIPTARGALLDLVDAARADDDLPLFIEVVTNFDELSITWPGDIVERFSPLGSLPGHWQVTSHRRATIVTGAAFAKAVRATFEGSK